MYRGEFRNDMANGYGEYTHINGSKYPIAMTKLSEGTTPAGSEWCVSASPLSVP